jgi:hypothetical protein
MKSTDRFVKEGPMNELLSTPEIQTRYPDEWVLLDNPQTDEKLRVLGGTVLHHSKDRDEVDRKMLELRPKRFTVLFTGTCPEDTEFVL